MKNQLEDLLNKIIDENNINDEAKLVSFLSDNNDVISGIEQAASSNDWVHFSQQTYDGWYCLQTNDDPVKIDVFNQERGANSWGVTSYTNKPEAFASVIIRSGYASF